VVENLTEGPNEVPISTTSTRCERFAPHKFCLTKKVIMRLFHFFTWKILEQKILIRQMINYPFKIFVVACEQTYGAQSAKRPSKTQSTERQ
jgi:hypothetical protein